MLLKEQAMVLELWYRAKMSLSERSRGDRGEVTATTAMIFLLVGAAIVAGGVIAQKITNNANNVPDP